MEYFFLYSFIFLSILSLAFLFLLFHHQPRGGHHRLPPGGLGWPMVGEMWEFLSMGWKGHPEKFVLDRLSKYAPSQVFKTSLFGEKTVVFCGASGNKFIFSNENKLVRSWWPVTVDKILPFNFHSSTYEESTQTRKLYSNFLNLEALQRYVPIMDTVAKRHFATEWEHKDEVEVYSLAKRFTFRLACRLFLSMDDPNQIDKLASLVKDIMAGFVSIPIDLPGTQLHRGVKGSKLARKEIKAIVKQRKQDLLADSNGNGNGDGNGNGNANSTNDSLSHMLLTPYDANRGRFMSEMYIADKILGLIVGAHDSASAACTFIVKFLADFPHIYEGVYREQMEIARSKRAGELLTWEDIQKMKYSWNVVCEVLRLVPPIFGGFREATTDFTYDGFQIPCGWKLHWSVHSTHKKPEYFPEPEKFDPSRLEGEGPAPYTFIPFGGGPRMCPGKEYARLEILVFIYNIVKRFKWEKIFADEKVAYNPLPVPVKGLLVRLRPHQQSPK